MLLMILTIESVAGVSPLKMADDCGMLKLMTIEGGNHYDSVSFVDMPLLV